MTPSDNEQLTSLVIGGKSNIMNSLRRKVVQGSKRHNFEDDCSIIFNKRNRDVHIFSVLVMHDMYNCKENSLLKFYFENIFCRQVFVCN